MLDVELTVAMRVYASDPDPALVSILLADIAPISTLVSCPQLYPHCMSTGIVKVRPFTVRGTDIAFWIAIAVCSLASSVH